MIELLILEFSDVLGHLKILSNCLFFFFWSNKVFGRNYKFSLMFFYFCLTKYGPDLVNFLLLGMCINFCALESSCYDYFGN